jgi:hypothetical protein
MMIMHDENTETNICMTKNYYNKTTTNNNNNNNNKTLLATSTRLFQILMTIRSPEVAKP